MVSPFFGYGATNIRVNPMFSNKPQQKKGNLLTCPAAITQKTQSKNMLKAAWNKDK
jgi:hypothetical protein